MDIAKVNPKNYLLRVLAPKTNKFTGLVIELAPMSDPNFKVVQRSITDKGLLKRQRGKIIDADEREKNAIDLIVSVVRNISWENDADGKPGNFGGEQLAFTETNVRALLEVDWLREEVEEALAEPANFF